MTDSTAAGYMQPVSAPIEGDALDDVLHGAIMGITGISGSLVRPRWQPEPPQQPDFNTDWVAFGIARTTPDLFSYSEQRDAGSDISRDEVLYVLHSFYGPNSTDLAARLRAGLDIAQNRAALRSYGILLREVQEPVVLPALLKEKWVKRIDVTVVYARRSVRGFTILPVESGQLGLNNELYVTPITTH